MYSPAMWAEQVEAGGSMPDLNYNPSNHYWIVAGSTTQVYASARVIYVFVADATYMAWLAAGHVVSKIDTEQNLADVLASYGLPTPPGTSPSNAQKDKWFADVPQAVRVWAFDIENRYRVSQGTAALTANQFKNYVKGLL